MPTAETPDSESAGRVRDASATRDALVLAATRAFALSGYDNATSRDIAHAAGVNVSLINRYFGSKEGLYVAVLERIDTMPTPPTDPDMDLVERFVTALLRVPHDEGEPHPLMVLIRGGQVDERTAALRLRSLDRWLEFTADELFGRPTGAAERPAASALFALFTGMVALREAFPGAREYDDPAAIEQTLRVAVAALRRRE